MENLFLARNISKEEIAVSNFLNAYIENLDSSSQKTPTELFALLLEQLSAACDVVSQEIATPESEGLLNTNQFLESILRQVQGLEPRKFRLKLNLNDFQTFIDAFQSLKPLAESYPNNSYICKRIDYFTNRLCDAVNAYDSANKKSYTMTILFRVCIVVFIVMLILCSYGIIGGGWMFGSFFVAMLVLFLRNSSQD